MPTIIKPNLLKLGMGVWVNPALVGSVTIENDDMNGLKVEVRTMNWHYPFRGAQAETALIALGLNDNY